MDLLGLTIALLLPWAMGSAWIALVWSWRPRSHLPAPRSTGVWLVLGYGYLGGIVFTTFVMRLAGAAGLGLRFPVLALLLGAMTVLALTLRQMLHPRSADPPPDPEPPLPLWQKGAIALVLALLAVRFGGGLLEVIWRPLYAWDAWMNFAPKARVWFELKELIPIVRAGEWLADPSGNSYMAGADRKRPAISLIHTWHALGLGRWDDALINLPWLLCGGALGMAFYGQARLWGVGALAAVLWVYLLLSMPYTDVNLLLAGYAEPWVAAVYALAAMAFFHWARDRDPRQALLAIVFAILCTQVKIPGIVWALTLVLALITSLVPGRVLGFGLIVVIGAAALVLATGGIEYKVPGMGWLKLTTETVQIPRLGALTYHPVGEAFVANGLLFANWHLLWYLFWPVFIYGVVSGHALRRHLLPATVTVVIGLVFLFVVYFFTRRYQFALDFTQINRAFFHMVPLLLFYIMVVLHDTASRIKDRQTDSNNPRPRRLQTFRRFGGISGPAL